MTKHGQGQQMVQDIVPAHFRADAVPRRTLRNATLSCDKDFVALPSLWACVAPEVPQQRPVAACPLAVLQHGSYVEPDTSHLEQRLAWAGVALCWPGRLPQCHRSQAGLPLRIGTQARL